MYLVPLPRVRLEVGDAGVRNAQELCRWLYGDGCEYASRAAPSVMTRSECELFGLSSPRFAYRLYIKRSGEAAFMTTFLNLRRLVYFAGALAYTGIAKDILSDTPLCTNRRSSTCPCLYRTWQHIYALKFHRKFYRSLQSL